MSGQGKTYVVISKQRCLPGFVDCRGTASTAKKCLWIIKRNLPNDQMVYWHHFNETEEIALEGGAVTSPMVCLALLRRSRRSNCMTN